MSVKFQDNHIQFEKTLDTAVKQFLVESAGEVVAETKRNTRVDYGQLKSSWSYRLSNDNIVYIGSTLQNAIWEEFGTGIRSSNGIGRKTPWYVPADTYRGTKKPTYNGKVTIVRGKDGKKFYKTNGKKKNPKNFSYSFNKKKSQIIKRGVSLFGNIFKGSEKYR